MSISSLEDPVTADLRREKLATGLIIGLVLCVGIAVRVRVVQLSGGLLRDDASLATSIVPRDEWELLRKPLFDDQVAPVGYLLLTKELVRWLGDGETVLRMPALVASILTLVIYIILGRQVLPVRGQVIGLVLMALSGPLISFAGRVKPYSSDVLVAVILLSAAIWAMRRPPTFGSYATLGILGVFGVVFSLPAVFMLGAIGLALIARSTVAGRLRESIGWVVVASLWLAVFLALYMRFPRSGPNDVRVNWYSTADTFAPFPPRSIAQIKWYNDQFFKLFQMVVGLSSGELAAVLFLFGAYMIATRLGRPVLGMFIMPLILALAASALKKYPFADRLLLFSCPLLVTLIAAGIAGVSRTDPNTRFLRVLLAAVLLLYPTYMTVKTLASGPFIVHDVKPALDHLADHWQEGDVAYVHFDADTLYNYYVNVLNYKNLRGKPFVVGIYPGEDASMAEQLAAYRKDIERVHGRKRVWFLFAMSHSQHVPVFESILDARGTRLDKFQGQGSEALLYNLSP